MVALQFSQPLIHFLLLWEILQASCSAGVNCRFSVLGRPLLLYLHQFAVNLDKIELFRLCNLQVFHDPLPISYPIIHFQDAEAEIQASQQFGHVGGFPCWVFLLASLGFCSLSATTNGRKSVGRKVQTLNQ